VTDRIDIDVELQCHICSFGQALAEFGRAEDFSGIWAVKVVIIEALERQGLGVFRDDPVVT
jgi:hypothetical protein